MALSATIALALARCADALNPALDINQCAHSAWTVRNSPLLDGMRAARQPVES